jgi:hypothetical protein
MATGCEQREHVYYWNQCAEMAFVSSVLTVFPQFLHVFYTFASFPLLSLFHLFNLYVISSFLFLPSLSARSLSVWMSVSVATFYQRIRPGPRLSFLFRKKLGVLRWWVFSTLPNRQAGGPPLSAVRDFLFNIFAATLHICRPSPPSATWGRAMPWWQRTDLIWAWDVLQKNQNGIKWTLGRLVGGVWSGSTWLRIGIVGGLLWMWWWTFGFWRHGVSYLVRVWQREVLSSFMLSVLLTSVPCACHLSSTWNAKLTLPQCIPRFNTVRPSCWVEL